MKKLISMVDYVLEQEDIWFVNRYNNIFKYANFLKQPLKLGMFVPCDEEGNVLEDPTPEDILYDDNIYEQYQQAKERVLFEGFETLANESVLNRNFIIHFLNGKMSIEEHFEEIVTKLGKQVKTIEDLVPYNLTLIEK